MKEESTCSVFVIHSCILKRCSLSASPLYPMTFVITHMHGVNCILSSPYFYFILKMQLNDVQNLEVVYWYENFNRESTGIKFRDRKKCIVYQHIMANFEH
jgi:hypothetical protein